MKRILIAILMLMAPGLVHAQTATVTGHVLFPSGGASTTAKVCFSLQNFKPNLPRVASTGIIVQQTNWCITPATDGSFSAPIFRNDLMLPIGTFWRVDFLWNGIQQSSATYIINHSPFNLDTETPLSQSVPVGPNQIINLCVPFQQVSPTTTWTITHNENDNVVFVTAVDLNGHTIFPDDVDTSNPNVAVITWITAQAGRALVCHGGAVSIATNQPNAIVSNPIGPQIINTGQTLTINANTSFTGVNSHSGAETFSGVLNANAGGNLNGIFTGSPEFSTGAPTFDVGFVSATPLFTEGSQLSFLGQFGAQHHLTWPDSVTGRTWAMPDAAGTVVLDTATQTLSAKTLASPALTTPTVGGGSAINKVVIGSGLSLNSAFTSITAATCQEQTLTLSGASTSGVASVSPTATIGANFNWSAWVSGSGTINVRVCAGSTATPTSVTWNAMVIQ